MMQLKLRKGFGQRVQARFDRFDMQVGILENDEHKEPRDRKAGFTDNQNISSYAGGPVRKTGRSGSVTLNEVSAANRARMDVNYLTDPFTKSDSNIIKFSQAFFKMASGKSASMKKRVENLMQAIVRNPILRGDYGVNSRITQKIKGFNRSMIDTAQLFKAIKASVKVKGRRV